ncbi:MAG: TIGR03545 family protein [Deltaproteobacteria bacterium]|nr:TIGR03545 family protein [Deltaproteobacteria bacterium]
MKQWIRWKGVAAFVVVTAVVSLLWFLLIDGFVERMIERTGTRLNGARVELDDADLTLFPAGLTLTGLHVTNPDKPMSNAVEIKQIAFTMDGLNLLRRKVIVDEMTVEGIRLNTPRKRSGAIARRPSITESAVRKAVCEEFEFSLPSFEIPDVKDILKSENLPSLQAVESLRTDIRSEQEGWKKRLNDLPGKAVFEKHKRRLEKLKAGKSGGIGGILGASGELLSFQKEVKRDLDRIRSAQKEFNEVSSSLRKRVDQAKKGPLEDVRRLKEKYALTPRGLENISSQLFSAKLCGWLQNSLAWHEKLKPAVERIRTGDEKERGEEGPEVVRPVRSKGVDVRFKEYAPLPDFLVRLASASANFSFGTVEGKIINITPDQDTLGIPLTFAFAGDNLKGLKSIKLTGTLNHIEPADTKDDVHLRIGGYRLENIPLSDSAALPITLQEGVADIKVDARMTGDRIKARVEVGFGQVKLASGIGEEAGTVAKTVASLLSDIRKLTITADVSGTLNKYDIKLSSDLDRILKNALGGVIKKQTALLEKRLTKEITGKLAGPMKGVNTDLGGLSGIGGELAGRLNLGSELLKGGQKKGLPGGIKLPF